MPPPIRAGLIGPRKRAALTARLLGERTFADLAIPCAVVAADLVRGREIVIDQGPLVPALLATTAIPGVFPPLVRGDELLVDGGLLNNLPVDVAERMGARQIIAVQLSDGLPPFDLPADPGAGLDAGQLMQVFEGFYRGDKSRSRDTGGSGLGLAIVKASVEAHGGRVTAQATAWIRGAPFRCIFRDPDGHLRCAVAAPLPAAALPNNRTEAPQKLGLVLGDGGGKAGAHLSVLAALEELDVSIDIIIGTSVGAARVAPGRSGVSTPGKRLLRRSPPNQM